MFDIPDYVPQVKGFWNKYRKYNDYGIRTNWINNNITCDRVKRLFGYWCARSVLHFYENEYPDDKRVRNAIEVAERFAFNEATREELEKAYNIAAAASVSASASASAAVSVYAYAAAVSTVYYASYDIASAYYAVSVSASAAVSPSARMNQNRALSLFKKPDNAPNDETLKLLCKFWYYDNRNLFPPIIDRLIELGLEDYRVRLMDENPECYRLGMWPFTPEMIK